MWDRRSSASLGVVFLGLMSGLAGCGLRPFDPVGHLRALIAAEAAFAEANAGLYGSLECLADPQSCGLAAAAAPEPFLSREQAAPHTSGWGNRLYLGSAASEPATGANAQSWALLLVPSGPLHPRDRFFCADDTGTIRWTRENRLPALTEAGRCPRSWEALPEEPAR